WNLDSEASISAYACSRMQGEDPLPSITTVSASKASSRSKGHNKLAYDSIAVQNTDKVGNFLPIRL
ncbi:MAG: hypothetical protein WBU20_19735, partial [Candidatus Acidiferrum sp.]